MFDRLGNFRPAGLGEEGVFHCGTRVLSRWVLKLEDRPVLLLGSGVYGEQIVLGVDTTNTDTQDGDRLILPKDSVHIRREAFLFDGSLATRLCVRSYHHETLSFTLSLGFAADFADIFQIRGANREQRGRLLAPRVASKEEARLEYEGLDGQRRTTRVTFDPAPTTLEGDSARFLLQLEPGEAQILTALASFSKEEGAPRFTFDQGLKTATDQVRAARRGDAALETSHEHFNAWLDRSSSDLHLLTTNTAHGTYPYAGVPWFSTPFGRDGLITALMYLWVNPEMARGVLLYLAKTQAQTTNEERDAEPGKILHEARQGEMAALGEIPFDQYYGTVDATLLFVHLAAQHYRSTGDTETLSALWPHVRRAIEWMDAYGDPEGDGLIAYKRQASRGIENQGWKDSDDAIWHADGRLAEPPIALSEVQAYAYAARRGAAYMAKALHDEPYARDQRQAAARLRKRFEKTFWLEDMGTYALALDRHHQRCRVRASNAGQCLFSGIAGRRRAARLADELVRPALYSGWGVRTVAEGEARYNPMSYHNGSIWPHDNALIALGLARYGLKDHALKIFDGMFAASQHFELNRMPELICGFPRRGDAGPTLYPVACSPQAWAAGSVFMLLQAALGLRLDAPRRTLRFEEPRLPRGVRRLSVKGLRVGDAEIDFWVERHREDVAVTVLRREGGELKVAIRK